MEKFIIRVFHKGVLLGEKLESCETVPRIGDSLEVGNASWEIHSVVWKWFGTYPMRVAVCGIHFGRESEDAYWTKKEFWTENGFGQVRGF